MGTNGWCEGMHAVSFFAIVLDLAVGWLAAGKQEDTSSCYQPHFEERFAHKCCKTGGLTQDVMYFVRMHKT